MENKYLKGKIYSIKNINNPDMIYIGSTTEPLNVRFSKHKHDSKFYNTRCSLYKHITDNNWRDWEINLVKDYPCDNKTELEREESRIILSHEKVINKKKHCHL